MANSASAPRRIRWLNLNVAATVLIVKILILIFAFQSYQIVTDKPLTGVGSFLEIWKHWDAEHYLRIAQNGYEASGENGFLIAFFPLYPALIWLVQTVFRDYLLSAFIVSGIATVALGIVFRELVRLDYSEKVAQYSVWFLFVFPTAYFLHIPYTESLFLALAVGCFLAARKRFWIVAGILGALACLTRINGLVLIAALAFEIWEEYRETKRFNRVWFGLLLIPSGFAAYLFLNYSVTGSTTAFMFYQREHFNRYLRFPAYGIWETGRLIFTGKPSQAMMNGMQEMLFVLIGLAAIVAGWKNLRNSYRVWMILNWLLFVSTSFVLSVPRYTLVLFPLFILMAIAATRSSSIKILLLVWSILYLSLFTTQFVRGWWAF